MMRILIVDDESLIRYSLTMTLKDAQTTVRAAANGADALAAVREQTFDVCFLDLHLPDMSGLDIMRVLRTASPGTRIVVISGEFLTPEMRKLVQDNAILFLEKPFDLEVVKSFVGLVRDQLHPSPEERRRHIRTATEKLILCSTLGPGNEACRTGLEAWLRDVSSSGMGISTDQALAPGSRVRLFDGMMMKEGTVRWSHASGRAGVYNIGVQFLPNA